MKKQKESKRANSVAGEYYVAAELLRRGFNVGVTIGNAKAVDILASRGDGGRPLSIQVKTTYSQTIRGKIKWILHAKDENHDPSKFYVFVQLQKECELPHFHIVPSEIVARYAKKTHKKFMSGKKRDGTPRKNVPMRRFEVFDSRYRDHWEYLSLRPIRYKGLTNLRTQFK